VWGRDGVGQLSLRRLYALRVGCLVLGGGLALVKWPLFFRRDTPWTLTEGVVNCLLAAMSLLAFLGLRYPVRMLPVLLFECTWKVIWLSVVACRYGPPMNWTPPHSRPPTRPSGCDHLRRHSLALRVFTLVTTRGDRWRSDPSRPGER